MVDYVNNTRTVVEFFDQGVNEPPASHHAWLECPDGIIPLEGYTSTGILYSEPWYMSVIGHCDVRHGIYNIQTTTFLEVGFVWDEETGELLDGTTECHMEARHFIGSTKHVLFTDLVSFNHPEDGNQVCAIGRQYGHPGDEVYDPPQAMDTQWPPPYLRYFEESDNGSLGKLNNGTAGAQGTILSNYGAGYYYPVGGVGLHRDPEWVYPEYVQGGTCIDIKSTSNQYYVYDIYPLLQEQWPGIGDNSSLDRAFYRLGAVIDAQIDDIFQD